MRSWGLNFHLGRKPVSFESNESLSPTYPYNNVSPSYDVTVYGLNTLNLVAYISPEEIQLCYTCVITLRQKTHLGLMRAPNPRRPTYDFFQHHWQSSEF